MQIHPVNTCRIPRRQNNAPVIGLGFDRVDALSQLVDSLSSVIRMHGGVLRSEMAPLKAVHWPEIVLLALLEIDGIQISTRSVGFPDL